MERNPRNAFQDLRQRHLYVSHPGFVHIKIHATKSSHVVSDYNNTNRLERLGLVMTIQGLQIGPCQDHFGSEGMDHGFQCFHCFFAQCMFHSFQMFLETNCHAVSVWHQCEVSVCPVMLTQRCLSLEYPAWWWRFPLQQDRQPCRVEPQEDRMNYMN